MKFLNIPTTILFCQTTFIYVKPAHPFLSGKGGLFSEKNVSTSFSSLHNVTAFRVKNSVYNMVSSNTL